MPIRCTGRETGAMNVYSIVPSQRSHATVSVTISKMIPRNAQITPPTSSFVVELVPCRPGRAPTPRAMNTIVSVLATVQSRNARSQRKYRLVRYRLRSTTP